VNLTGGAQLAVTEGEGFWPRRPGWAEHACAAAYGAERASTGEAGPGGLNSEEKFFSNKIGFLNLPRLWKFVEGDLGGILTCGFFLNSSRLLKDFRKL
jgi:hypothetical protein